MACSSMRGIFDIPDESEKVKVLKVGGFIEQVATCEGAENARF